MALPAAPYPQYGQPQAQPAVPGYLDVATSIGDRLCRDALWDGDRCTWAGSAVEWVAGAWPTVWRTFGADLYSGTAGVALFLARLHGVTGDAKYADVAAAALRQARPLAAALPPEAAFGLYTGRPGVALAMLALADATGDTGHRSGAAELLATLVDEELRAPVVDLLAGDAGALQAILALRPADRSGALDELTVRLGDRLIDLANRHSHGWSWSMGDASIPLDLNGYAHGAGGIGLALAELAHASAEARFAEAATRAFDYERHWFSPEHGNWPDLREVTAEQAEQRDALVYPVLWCHGAGGVALARLRAYRVSGDERLRDEARVALETVYAHVTQVFQAAYGQQGFQHNFSLCHGLGGLAESLLYGWQVLGDDRYLQMAAGIGQYGAAAIHAAGLPWPCGVLNGGEAPGLLLGLAGIGYQYLRLHDPDAVPPVLVLEAAPA